jgi:integrase/recombinase XerD
LQSSRVQYATENKGNSKMIRLLRKSLNYGLSLLQLNPVVQTKQRNYNQCTQNTTSRGTAVAQARVLTERELKRVLSYIQTQPYPARNRCMLLMTHWAGMRVGEVAALRLGDVIAADGTIADTITLSAAQTKGDKPRTVLLSKRLQQELAAYLTHRFALVHFTAVLHTDTTRALFPTQKNPKRGFTANTLCQQFHKFYTGAGLTGASSHSGRRTFITKLADKGVGVRVIMALSGHRQLSTVQRYIDVNPLAMKAAVELV